MLQTIVLILHVLTSLFIVSLVLLQRGKGADAGTGFGAGASGTVFGARGSASFLSRTTAALATMFFATSLALAFFANRTTAPRSLLEGSAPTEQVAPQPQANPPAEQSELPDIGDDAGAAGAGDDLPSLDDAGGAPADGAADEPTGGGDADQ